MINPNSYILNFKLDKLTDSILNRISGDSFRTEIILLNKSDLKKITKLHGWLFNWKHEFNQIDREVYKLTITDNPDIIQGLISLSIKPDHVYMNLLESSPFNRGKTNYMKEYQEILLHLPVNYHFREVEKDLFLLRQKQNLLTIILNHLEHITLKNN